MQTIITKTFSIGESLLVSVVGVLVVFAALVIILLVIKLMTGAFNGKKPAVIPAEAAAPSAPAAAPALARGSCGDVQLFDVDDRTAAELMAITADKLDKPLNQLHFVSIKEINVEEK